VLSGNHGHYKCGDMEALSCRIKKKEKKTKKVTRMLAEVTLVKIDVQYNPGILLKKFIPYFVPFVTKATLQSSALMRHWTNM